MHREMRPWLNVAAFSLLLPALLAAQAQEAEAGEARQAPDVHGRGSEQRYVQVAREREILAPDWEARIRKALENEKPEAAGKAVKAAQDAAVLLAMYVAMRDAPAAEAERADAKKLLVTGREASLATLLVKAVAACGKAKKTLPPAALSALTCVAGEPPPGRR